MSARDEMVILLTGEWWSQQVSSNGYLTARKWAHFFAYITLSKVPDQWHSDGSEIDSLVSWNDHTGDKPSVVLMRSGSGVNICVQQHY